MEACLNSILENMSILTDIATSLPLLRVPIVLLMICVIFEERNSLLKTRTETMRQIIELTIDRTTLKSFSEGMYEDIKGFQGTLL